ncbi:MAG: protein kinase, partial [Blastocatellia bacterium]|nr:protein kinase [Blastocatellia bacterium]
IHPVNGYSLRADRNNAIPHGERMWQVIENAYQSLAAIHQVGIIHRGLTPDRIFISDEGKVVFTDFSLSKIQGALTVADDADLFGKDSNYCAPECKREISLATKSSDLFSLTASILYWLTAIEPPAWGSMLGNIPPEVDKHLGSLLDRCIDEEESKRPPLNEIINRVSNKRKQLQDPRKLRLNQEFLEPGSIITDQYKIVRRLGEGATAVTYLAEDIVADSLFVLKKIKSPELIARLAKTEFKTLATLHHPNLPRIYDIRPANSPFHLKMEYIVGSSLLELMENSIAKTDFCIKIGLQLLSALNYLEQKNILHRDISPGNIIVTDEETVTVKLIDFGLATKDIASTSSVGTPRYRAPEIDKGGNWTTACDIYSLGAVLFELLTGKLPYLFDNFNPRKDSIIELTEAEKEHFDENLLNILLKAVAPDPEKRFKNALDFTAALKHLTSSTSFNIAKQKTSLIIGKRAINHFVNELRGSYRNSKYGNSDNRGLDTEFATSTYVPTPLDTHLLPAILSGKFRLVILSGNPGDGKTAFLQRTRSHLRNLGAVLVEEDPSGWHYRLNNREFAAINDASESHQEKSSDQLLHNILHPLSNTINDKYTAIVAANDGRLLDFFEKYSSQYSWLWNGFREQFLEGKTSYSEVILVDLKRRSLVAYSAQESSFFSAIMAQFVDDRRWEICNSCLAKNDCPIRFNVLSFSDTNLRQSIVSGLHHLIFAVHLQREHRPTVRDLRSALAFLITHDLSCEDIHQELEGQISSLSFSQRLYFNAAFDKRKLPDLLLDQWYHLDPALVANPRLDRFIYFHRQSAQDLESIFTTAPLRPKINQVYTTTQTLTEQYWLATIKRRYFFEGNGHLLDLPETKQLFAYHYYWDFVSALFGKIDEELLLKRLTRGISKIDGVPDSACNNTLSFRINQDSEIAVVKQFPISNFQIGRTFSGLEFTEEVPDQLLLEHKSGFPSLTISLDLFEFISKACEGVLTGAKEQQVLIEDLAIFKNRLLACSTSDVLIIESGKKFSRVKADKGSLKRQEVEN